jgi:hypothetical protein
MSAEGCGSISFAQIAADAATERSESNVSQRNNLSQVGSVRRSLIVANAASFGIYAGCFGKHLERNSYT